MATAAARAAHLIVDREPWIFEDTLAAVLLGDLAEELIDNHRDAGQARELAAMRVAMTGRSRYTEDRLAESCRRGITQYVLLGAGLDSFAYRSPLASGLRVFEVDHPATQAWKRERLTAAAVPVPDWVTFVEVDFTVDALGDRLTAAGFDSSRPAFVSWIGVTQYLPSDAIAATLDVVAGFCPGSELAVEYMVPPAMRDGLGSALADFYMPRAAAMGEPWLTFLTPAAAAGLLAARGMVVTDDVGRVDQVGAPLWKRSDGLRPYELGRVALATCSWRSSRR